MTVARDTYYIIAHSLGKVPHGSAGACRRAVHALAGASAWKAGGACGVGRHTYTTPNAPGAGQKISCIVYVLRPTGALVPASPCTTSRFHTARAALTCTHAEVFTSAVIFLRIGRTVP